MFDIGFTEVTLIAVIGLLVIGPERLPRVAREVGLWVGRLRRYVASVRADIEREVRAEELRELVNQPAQELKDAIKETGKSIKDTQKSLEKELNTDTEAADASSAGTGEARKQAAPAPAADGAGAVPAADASSSREGVESTKQGAEKVDVPAREPT